MACGVKVSRREGVGRQASGYVMAKRREGVKVVMQLCCSAVFKLYKLRKLNEPAEAGLRLRHLVDPQLARPVPQGEKQLTFALSVL